MWRILALAAISVPRSGFEHPLFDSRARYPALPSITPSETVMRSCPSLLRIILLVLLLLLLVDLLLTLEDILHNLLLGLRRPRVAVAEGSFHRRGTRRLGRRIGIVILRVAAVQIVRGRVRTGGGSGAQNDLKQGVSVTAADHEHVVAGAFEELPKYVAPWAGAVAPEDALILGESFQFRTCAGGDLMQNLVEAGIERFDFEAVPVPTYPGQIGRLVSGPDRSGRGRWRRGYRFRSGLALHRISTSVCGSAAARLGGGLLLLRRRCALRGVRLCGKILSAQDCRHDQKRED